MIDIDGTICTQTASSYTEAEPYPDRIAKINELHDKGDEIIYWTARGMASYHQLWMCKPSYDVWVDDKAQWLF